MYQYLKVKAESEQVPDMTLQNGHTWFQCTSCQTLLNNLSQFMCHVDNHDSRDSIPVTLLQTENGLSSLIDLPESYCQSVFVPKIVLESLELVQKSAGIHIKICYVTITRVDEAVQVTIKKSITENQCEQGETKVKVQKRRKFYGKCFYCKRNLNWMTMKSHVSKCPNRPKYYCPECAHRFPTANAVSAHVELYHKNRKEYKCQGCLKLFATLRAVKKHGRDTPCRKKIEAIQESETVSASAVLNLDATRATRPFPPCVNCGRAIQPRRLEAHSKKCSSSSPVFHCLYSCPANFKSAQDLSDHVTLYHKTEPKYKCELCGKPFSVFEAMKRHLDRTCLRKQAQSNVAASEKSNSCHFCGKRFKSLRYLRQHKCRRRVQQGPCLATTEVENDSIPSHLGATNDFDGNGSEQNGTTTKCFPVKEKEDHKSIFDVFSVSQKCGTETICTCERSNDQAKRRGRQECDKARD